jgi:peptide/nickel transport system substrate-binding protein
MKKQVWWLLFAYLVSIAFLITSCGSSTITTNTTTKTTVSITQDQTTKTSLEEPEYGGTLTLIPIIEVGIFDGVAMGQTLGPAAQLTRDAYMDLDWTRGTAGTGEIDWVPNISGVPDTCIGLLAESWEIPELGTIVYKVRQGVHWAFNPKSEASRMMNGREVTADDWIASFDYMMSHPRSLIRSVAPQLFGTATMEKTGPWEVTLRTPVDPLTGWNWLGADGIFPPEVIARYGDMQDWRNVVGTGPFMLTDYIPGSSATLVRNPDYWDKDPVGPGKGNQLPYLDGVKILIVMDISTMSAAIRTARVDFFPGFPAEDTLNIIQSVPGIMYSSYVAGDPTVIAMRIDKNELPYKDKRVRQALMLATDFNTLKDDFFSGKAEILAFPVSSESKQAYMPLEVMPESAQSLYRYDPEKAKQLLVEAGYPDGFTARMIYLSAYDFSDLASVYQAMWAKVGINLELQPKEMVAFLSIGWSRSYEDMILTGSPGGSLYPFCLDLLYFKSPCFGFFSDPFIETTSKEIQKHVIIDMPEADRLFRELMPYIVEQAYYLPVPSFHAYSLWWPWLKNYHGETWIRFAKYWWIDRDLKEEMTGRR